MEKIRSAIKYNRAFRNAGLTSELRLVKVNGVPDRVTGFVDNGKEIYYISIDCGRLGTRFGSQFLYRRAESSKDFTGGRNQYAESSEDLVAKVLEAFEK